MHLDRLYPPGSPIRLFLPFSFTLFLGFEAHEDIFLLYFG